MSVLACVILAGCTQTGIKSEDPAQSYVERITQDPDDALAHGALADIYLQKYKDTKKVAYRDKAIGEYQAFMRVQKEHVKVSLILYALLAEKAVAETDDTTLEKIDALYNVTPVLKQAKLAPPGLVEALMVDNRQMSQKSKETVFVKALKLAIKQNPEMVTSHVLLARFYLGQERDELALVLLLQASKVEPDNIDVNRLLASLYSSRVSAYDCVSDAVDVAISAISAYKVLIKHNPEDVVSHSRLAFLYRVIGQTDLDEFEAKRSLDLQVSTITRFDYASALMTNGKLDESIQAFEAVLKSEPRNVQIIKEYSQLQFVRRNWELAEVNWLDYKQLASQDYFYGDIRYYFTLHKLSRAAEAERYLREQVSVAELTDWEKSIYDYLSGDLGEHPLLSRASNRCEQTEAEYYAGFNAEIRNDFVKANSHYSHVLELGVVSYLEYAGAAHFLKSGGFSKKSADSSLH